MIYRFGHFRLDAEALELRGPEGVVAAEPRVLETLIHLVENAGRVVSKDELAGSVWGGAHVTDSAIARSVMAARRALGEDAASAVAIRTVHGRGYRFDQAVEALEAGSADPARSPRVPWPAAGLAVVGVLALLLGALGWHRAVSPPSATAAGAPVPLALEFVVPPHGDELHLLALSLEEELRRAVDDMPEIELVEEEAPAQAAFLLVARVAPGETPGYAHLDVSVRPAADGADGRSGSAIPLARHEIPYRLPAVGVGRFVAVRAAVARQVVERLPTAVGSGPTGSEAMRLYLMATVGWKVACDGGVAAELLSRAVELDPELAPAWYLLAGAYWNRAELCVGDAALLDEAERAAARATELAPDSPEPRQLAAGIVLHRGRVDEAYVTLQELAAEYPGKPAVLVRLSEALRYAGFVDAAGDVLERALRSHPESSFLSDFVPYPDLYAGRWDRFLRALSGRGSPYFRYYRGYAQAMRGDREAARGALGPAFLDHPGDLFGRLCQALLANLTGEPEEARVVLRQLARQRTEKGARDGEVTYKIGELLILSGAPDEGFKQLGLAVEQGFFCPRCLATDPVLAPVADDQRFHAVLAAATERHLRFARTHGLAPEAPEISPPTPPQAPARRPGPPVPAGAGARVPIRPHRAPLSGAPARRNAP